MSTDGPVQLSSVLQSVIDGMGLRTKIDEARVIETWAALAGPQINNLTQSVWMKGDTLYVKVRSSAWRQELHMRRSAWRDRLNDELGSPLVKEIVLR